MARIGPETPPSTKKHTRVYERGGAIEKTEAPSRRHGGLVERVLVWLLGEATYKRTGQLERNIIATLFFILAFCLVFSVAHTCLNPNACEAERSRRIANQEQAMRLRLEIDRLKASFAAQPAWSAKELEEPQDPAAEQVPADSTAVQVPAEEERHSAMAEGTPAEEEAGDDAGDSAALSQKRGFLSQE